MLTNVALDNTVNISWTGPSQPNGPIKAYTVYFTPVDPAERDENYKRWPKVVIPSTEDSGLVTLDKSKYNLLPDHDYSVRVSATNDLSEGPASGIVRFTTGSGEIPPSIVLDPPTNPVIVDPESDYSVTCRASAGVPTPRIRWALDSNAGTIVGPTLHLRSIVKDTTATCHGANNAGVVQEVLEVRVAGPGTSPNEIVINPQREQAINVEWTAPDEPNGQITGYVVHYGEIPEGESEPREWYKETVGGDQVTHKIEGLKPKTNYGVKVQAISDRGPGVISEPPTMTRTLPLAPKPPVVSDVKGVFALSVT